MTGTPSPESVDRVLPESSPRFAAIVPIAATPLGLWRGLDLIHSLLRWEPELAWCVLLVDGQTSFGLSELALFPSSCRTVTLANPLPALGPNWIGGLTAGILRALSWLHAETDARFVLRIDTDALVIAPFARSVLSTLAQSPRAGVIGAIGSCSPAVRSKVEMRWEPGILRARRLWPSGTAIDAADATEPGRFNRPSARQMRAFDAVRPHIDTAVLNGYITREDCQGGACVVSRLMMDRMAVAGYLTATDDWSLLPFADDRVLAMYARAVGLNLLDCSAPGQPFGVQATGLAYPPEELVAQGYSLIHSVKNDRHMNEERIRSFFRERRLRL